ncbi:MAG TPA: PPE family protein, partial [Mycobacterium sp.]|nr:PPE family protein [Mycobacterium sp.]
MSFLVSPPEINSSLMYGGAGSGPMLAAAAAWDGLATELGSAAQSFSSLTSELAGQAWQGAASAAMMTTAAQYAGFLNAAATQAQTAAAQAQAVASAFESALAATVHPLLVAANRNGLVQLVASNLFGQNAPAIAAMESHYEQMWAQDVAAMVGYHGGASAAAAQLSAWPAALQGLSSQISGAVANNPLIGAALSSAGSALSSLDSAASSPVGSALGSLNSAAGSGPIGGLLGTVEQDVTNAINAPTEFLLGRPLIGGYSLGGAVTGGTATAPLTMFAGTQSGAVTGGTATAPLTMFAG